MKAGLSALVLTGFALFSMCHGASAGPPIVITEQSAGFSWTIPSGWRTQERPGGKSPIAFTDREPGFRPNIVETERKSPMSLADYVKGNIGAMQRGMPQFRLVSQTAFETDSHIKGIRFVAEGTFQEHKIRDIYYFFPGKGNLKYVLTFSSLAETGDKFDSTVDGAIRTFKLL